MHKWRANGMPQTLSSLSPLGNVRPENGGRFDTINFYPCKMVPLQKNRWRKKNSEGHLKFRTQQEHKKASLQLQKNRWRKNSEGDFEFRTQQDKCSPAANKHWDLIHTIGQHHMQYRTSDCEMISVVLGKCISRNTPIHVTTSAKDKVHSISLLELKVKINSNHSSNSLVSGPDAAQKLHKSIYTTQSL